MSEPAVVPVPELDELPSAPAAELLRACCGSARWVDAMVGRRPFHTLDVLLAEAEDAWWSLEPDDWLEAFAHHPRVGEGVAATPQDARGPRGAANREYERRFGHIYIVCATGKSAEEMLAIARTRLANDAEVEVRVAAEEQRKITRLRLEKLLTDETA